MTSPTDPVAAGLARYHETLDALSRANAHIEKIQNINASLETENQLLRQRIEKIDDQLGFYIRFSAELKANLDTAMTILNESLVKARLVAYKPNGNDRDEGVKAVESALTTEPINE